MDKCIDCEYYMEDENATFVFSTCMKEKTINYVTGKEDYKYCRVIRNDEICRNFKAKGE